VVAALDRLARAGAVTPQTVEQARGRYGWQA